MTHSCYTPSSISRDNSSKFHSDCLAERTNTKGTITLSKSIFGFLKNATNGEDEPVSKFTWRNRNLMTVSVMTYGATILKIEVPNRKMKVDDIVLGFDTLEEYIKNKDYNFGATLGRVAGILKKPDKQNEFIGLSNVNWISSVDGVTLVLSYLSPHGDEGYPGNLLAQVTYQITEDNRFIVTYRAAVDIKTPVNMCHRLYFNLAGHSAGPIELLKHVFHMNCDKMVETKNTNDNFLNVGSTNYDLRVPQLMIMALSKINTKDTASFFSINDDDEYKTKQFVGQFIHRQSGRAMEIYSNQKFVTFSPCNNFPGKFRLSKLDLSRFQLPLVYLSEHKYTILLFNSRTSEKSADKMKNQRTQKNVSRDAVSKILEGLFQDSKDLNEPKINGKESATYRKNCGFYVQCQYFPTAVYHPTFSSEIILHPSNIYENEIEYKFGLCDTQ